jgi:hypothetical protein
MQQSGDQSGFAAVRMPDYSYVTDLTSLIRFHLFSPFAAMLISEDKSRAGCLSSAKPKQNRSIAGGIATQAFDMAAPAIVARESKSRSFDSAALRPG